jgi:hypothetical protein
VEATTVKGKGKETKMSKERITVNERITVLVDQEYTAEYWWDALRERYPAFARVLERNGRAVITVTFWKKIASLPGFTGGPEYAPTALMISGR